MYNQAYNHVYANRKEDKMTTIQQAFEEYISQLRNSKSANTARTYQDSLEVFAEYLGDTTGSINELSAQKFIEFPAWLVGHYNSRQSAMLRDTSIKSFRRWLQHKRYIQWTSEDDADYAYAKENAFSKHGEYKPKVVSHFDILKAIEFVPEMDTFYPIERTRNVAIIYLLAS